MLQRCLLLCAGLCLLLLPAASQAADPPPVPPGVRADLAAGGTARVIVLLHPPSVPQGAAEADQAAAVAQAQDALLNQMAGTDMRMLRRYQLLPAVALEVDSSALRRLQASNLVARIDQDLLMPPALAQSTALIGAPEVWQAGLTGAGWTIAILDTGVESAHPFLTGKVVAEACFSTTDVGQGAVSLCPGGAPSAEGVGTAQACGTNYCDHGTHVAGIAAGRSIAFSGVAPDATLISVQVYSQFNTLCSSLGLNSPCVLSYSSDQLAGLEWVYNRRSAYQIAAVNMSLGGQVFQNAASCDIAAAPVKQAIDLLRAAGIPSVIASGNYGATSGISVPACISSAISVGSMGMDGTVETVSSFSNRASFLSLLAPGESILASVPGGGFSTKSGTSMAAPHVAGAWALMRQHTPNASVGEILTYLQITGVPVVDQQFVLRRIDLPAAINYADIMQNLSYRVRLPIVADPDS